MCGMRAELSFAGDMPVVPVAAQPAAVAAPVVEEDAEDKALAARLAKLQGGK
jgi:hypothetical protein